MTWKAILSGWKIAKETGRLDIGQTVVVKNQAVMAVEAIDGTDEAIIRLISLRGEELEPSPFPFLGIHISTPCKGHLPFSSFFILKYTVLYVTKPTFSNVFS